MAKIPYTVKIICLLGLIPFIMGTVGTFKLNIFGIETNNFFIELALLYSALILSFLGGCLFGFETLSEPFPRKSRLWLAILPTIWALLALQIPYFKASAMAIGFMIVFEFDRRASRNKITPEWWLNLRLPLTICVIISLAIIGFHD